jgi:hypothetical protein
MKACARIIMIPAALWVLALLGSSLWAQAGVPRQEREGAGRGRHGEEAAPGAGQKHRRGAEERKRWEGLPEGRKERFKERFERFRSMPPEKQEELRKKHAELVRLREEITAEFEQQLARMTPEERKRFVDERVRRKIEELKRRIDKKELLREGPPPESEEFARRMGRALNSRNDKLAEKLLHELLADGAIDSGTAHRIGSLPREERIASILELHKKRFMQTLEESVTTEELERFEKMPPRRFNREIRRHSRERGLFGPLAGLCELTPVQREALGQIADDAELERRRIFFFHENLRRRLVEMGVAQEAVDALLSQPLHRRMEGIRRLLNDIPPEKMPPDLRESLKRPPPPRGRGEDAGRRNGARPPSHGEKRGDRNGTRKGGARRNGMRPPPPGNDPHEGGRFFHAPGRNR